MNLSTIIPNGYGTYISAAVLAAASIAKTFGWIDESTYQTILGLAGATGLGFLRRSVSSTTADLATGQAVIAKKVGVPKSSIEENIGPQPPPKVA